MTYLCGFQGDEEESDANTSMEEKKDPTHYSELDPKTMKVWNYCTLQVIFKSILPFKILP